MATNRLSLQCAICQDEFCLAKTMTGEWYRSTRPELLDAFDGWLMKHQECGGGVLSVNLSRECDFFLKFASDNGVAT